MREAGLEQDILKWHFDTLLFRVLDSEGRAPPGVQQEIFFGVLRRVISRALVRRDRTFFYSLQKGCKKSWPALSDARMFRSMDKHRTAVSTPPQYVPPFILRAIGLQSRSTFGQISVLDLTKFSPSFSACASTRDHPTGRADGGAASLIPEWNPVGDSLRQLSDSYHYWRQSSFEGCAVGFGNYRSLRELTAHENVVEIVSIPEPAKFRTISKGSGYAYTFLQPLQGAMINAWKKESASTMDDADLRDRLQRQFVDNHGENPWGEQEPFCSVDYESATDLLELSATESAISQVGCLDGTRNDRTLFASVEVLRDTLLNVWADYPTKLVQAMGGPGRVKIVRGQMMGHPCSFPLLCVINLTVYRLSLCLAVAADLDDLEVDVFRKLGGSFSRTEHYPESPVLSSIEGPSRVPILKKMGPHLIECAMTLYRMIMSRGSPKEIRDSLAYGPKVNGWSKRIGPLSAVDVLKRQLSRLVGFETGRWLWNRWNSVWVNGDDLLHRSPRRVHELFLEVSRSMGFKLSVGKFYVSMHSALINSQLFALGGEDRNVIRRVGYLNFNVLEGSSLKAGDSHATPEQLSKDLNRIFELVPWALPTIPKVMDRWKTIWYGKDFQPNWFLPVYLGGLGLDRKFMGEHQSTITKAQRSVAARFVMDPELVLWAQGRALKLPRPLQKKDIERKLGWVDQQLAATIIEEGSLWDERLELMTKAFYCGGRAAFAAGKIASMTRRYAPPKWRSWNRPMTLENLLAYATKVPVFVDRYFEVSTGGAVHGAEPPPLHNLHL